MRSAAWITVRDLDLDLDLDPDLDPDLDLDSWSYGPPTVPTYAPVFASYTSSDDPLIT